MKEIKDIVFIVIAVLMTIMIYIMAFDDLSSEISATEVEETTTEEETATEAETTTRRKAFFIIEEETTTEPVNVRREVTDEEYNLLLRVCMSEAGGKYGEPLEGKIAVVETVLNRVDLGYGSISEVINKPYQYSTADNGEPDETVIQAVEIALSGDMYPDNMIWFRTDYYHDFGTPYKQIGAHYFSLTEVE